ncbi:hypothetical protein HDV00_008049 [Rhizophlyctis rosea]|nr:hypothetical protein HDV00_008049 [Rhizophlyctis rosea]
MRPHTTLLRPLTRLTRLRAHRTIYTSFPDTAHHTDNNPAKPALPGIPHFGRIKDWDPVALKAVPHSEYLASHPEENNSGMQAHMPGRAAQAVQAMAATAADALGESEVTKVTMKKEEGVEVAEIFVDGVEGCGYAGIVINDGGMQGDKSSY